MFKIFIPLFVVIFLSSCAFNNKPYVRLPKKYQKNIYTKNITPKKKYEKVSNTGFHTTTSTSPKSLKNKELKFYGNGYIKGIIKKFYYSKQRNSWIYYIKGTNLSNFKLKSALVYGKKYPLKVGNLVYATINNGKITSLYIFGTSKTYKFKKNKNLTIRKKIKMIKKKNKKDHKNTVTRERKQVINAPVEEKITF